MEPSTGAVIQSPNVRVPEGAIKHTSEQKKERIKPYACIICKKAFSKAVSLQNHMVTVHHINEEDEEDESDDEGDIAPSCVHATAEGKSASNDHGSFDGADRPDSANNITAQLVWATSGETPLKSDSLCKDGHVIQGGSQNSRTGRCRLGGEETESSGKGGHVIPGDIVAQAATAAMIMDPNCPKDDDGDRNEDEERSFTAIAHRTSLSEETIKEDHLSVIKPQCGSVHVVGSSGDGSVSTSLAVNSGKSELTTSLTPMPTLPLDLSGKLDLERSSSESLVLKHFQCSICSDKFTELQACIDHTRTAHKSLEQKKHTSSSAKMSMSRTAEVQPKWRKPSSKWSSPTPNVIQSGGEELYRGRKSKRKAIRHKQDMHLFTEKSEDCTSTQTIFHKHILPREQGEEIALKSRRRKTKSNDDKVREQLQVTGLRSSSRLRARRWVFEGGASKQAEDTGKLTSDQQKEEEKLGEVQKAVAGRSRKTFEEKMADLQKANVETLRISKAVRRLVGRRRAPSKPVSNLTQGDGQPEDEVPSAVPIERVTTCTLTPSGGVVGVLRTCSCVVCNQQFPTLEDCLAHTRVVHRSTDTPSLSGEKDAGLAGAGGVRKGRKRKMASGDATEDDRRVDEGVVESKQPTGKKPSYPCRYCGEVSRSVEGAKLHMSIHCGKVDTKCHKCEVFQTRLSPAELDQMARSVEEVRDRTGSEGFKHKSGTRLLVQFFQCIICNSCFAVEKHFRNHLSTHEVVSCQFCNAVFPNTQALSKHIPCHNQGPLVCRTCKQTFYSTSMLLMHIRGHTKDFRCEECGSTFMNQGNLTRHVRQKHRDSKEGGNPKLDEKERRCAAQNQGSTGDGSNRMLHSCPVCSNLHRTEWTLRKHMETFHPEQVQEKGRFVCEVCGEFRHKFHQLRAHMLCHQQPRHRCPHCGRLFLRPHSLNAHIKRVHENRMDFVCRFCGKRLAAQQSLIFHERLHTGEKPYVCAECGKGFRLRDSYRTHMTTEHAKNRPFRCPECNKGFFTQTTLSKHRKTHAPEEECVCVECGKKFKRPDLLKSHLVQHRQTVQCPRCSRCFSTDLALRYHMNKVHKINLYRTGLPQRTSPSRSRSPDAAELAASAVFKDHQGVSDPDLTGDKGGVPVGMFLNDSDRVDILPAPSTIDSCDIHVAYGADPRLSDPTNLAITTIMSQLCDRTLAASSD